MAGIAPSGKYGFDFVGEECGCLGTWVGGSNLGNGGLCDGARPSGFGGAGFGFKVDVITGARDARAGSLIEFAESGLALETKDDEGSD